jgi:putative membrane protein
MKRTILAASVLSLSMLPSLAMAQLQQQPTVPNQQRQQVQQPIENGQQLPHQVQRPPQGGQRFSAQPQQMQQNHDAVLAAVLMIGNQGEIEAGKLAAQRADNADVKKFAQQMVDQHSKLLQQLQQIAGPMAQNNHQQPGQSFDFLSLHRELGQACMDSTRQELESKQGAEFDKCYVGMQIGAHKHMLDTLKVFRNHASPQFQQTLTQAIDTTQQHLDHAKKLMKDLEKS